MQPITFPTLHCLKWLSALALIAVAAAPANAQGYERPPSYSPAAALGAAARGANYSVSGPVVSDGMLRHYTVNTSYGEFETTGDQLMHERIKELDALNTLQKTNGAQEFGQAAAKAGLGPVIFAGNLIAHPVDTTQNTVAGVGQFFNGVGSGLNNMGKSRDDAIASITGESREKRLIATQLGVDPYTDFKPLANKLDALASAAAAGNLAVTGAFILTPGAAGAVAANTSTASTLNGMVKDYSAAQLMDMNREKLVRLGVSSATAERLLVNRNYTPLDVTAMVEALASMGAVKNVDAMVAGAASADSRDEAYFIRRRIELTAAYQRRTHSIVAFANPDDPRLAFGVTASGSAVGVFPIDALSWTPETAKAVEGMTSAAGRDGATGGKSLVITGTATPLAAKNLASLGWTVRTGEKP